MRSPLILTLIFAFFLSAIGPAPVYSEPLNLPKPGVMVRLSPEFTPPILRGLKVNPDNPFKFHFIIDEGEGSADLKQDADKLIKYFLAALTIPEKDLWVNLSPYEKERIIPESFSLTEMGRDLLAQDYMLKQITASLIYPEDELGQKFWKRIYEEAAKKFNTTEIPFNTFNKVWIIPEKAVVFENPKNATAYVVETKLKVMLEEDYLALTKNAKVENSSIGSKVVREIVIPQLEKEVNEGKNFAKLRQVYHSLVLATWYKKKIKDSVLAQVYSDKNKTAGIEIKNPKDKEIIYQQYLQAFKKGVYNYIKEEKDPLTQTMIPRKYFSGGFGFTGVNEAMVATLEEPKAGNEILSGVDVEIRRAAKSSWQLLGQADVTALMKSWALGNQVVLSVPEGIKWPVYSERFENVPQWTMMLRMRVLKEIYNLFWMHGKVSLNPKMNVFMTQRDDVLNLEFADTESGILHNELLRSFIRYKGDPYEVEPSESDKVTEVNMALETLINAVDFLGGDLKISNRSLETERGVSGVVVTDIDLTNGSMSYNESFDNKDLSTGTKITISFPRNAPDRALVANAEEMGIYTKSFIEAHLGKYHQYLHSMNAGNHYNRSLENRLGAGDKLLNAVMVEILTFFAYFHDYELRDMSKGKTMAHVPRTLKALQQDWEGIKPLLIEKGFMLQKLFDSWAARLKSLGLYQDLDQKDVSLLIYRMMKAFIQSSEFPLADKHWNKEGYPNTSPLNEYERMLVEIDELDSSGYSVALIMREGFIFSEYSDKTVEYGTVDFDAPNGPIQRVKDLAEEMRNEEQLVKATGLNFTDEFMLKGTKNFLAAIGNPASHMVYDQLMVKLRKGESTHLKDGKKMKILDIEFPDFEQASRHWDNAYLKRFETAKARFQDFAMNTFDKEVGRFRGTPRSKQQDALIPLAGTVNIRDVIKEWQKLKNAQVSVSFPSNLTPINVFGRHSPAEKDIPQKIMTSSIFWKMMFKNAVDQMYDVMKLYANKPDQIKLTLRVEGGLLAVGMVETTGVIEQFMKNNEEAIRIINLNAYFIGGKLTVSDYENQSKGGSGVMFRLLLPLSETAFDTNNAMIVEDFNEGNKQPIEIAQGGRAKAAADLFKSMNWEGLKQDILKIFSDLTTDISRVEFESLSNSGALTISNADIRIERDEMIIFLLNEHGERIKFINNEVGRPDVYAQISIKFEGMEVVEIIGRDIPYTYKDKLEILRRLIQFLGENGVGRINMRYLKSVSNAFFLELQSQLTANGISTDIEDLGEYQLLIADFGQPFERDGFQVNPKRSQVNQAMLANNGGIDLTSGKTLQIKSEGEGIKFKMDPAMLKEFQNAPGFVPVIINIQPVTDLRLFLGLNDSPQTTAAL